MRLRVASLSLLDFTQLPEISCRMYDRFHIARSRLSLVPNPSQEPATAMTVALEPAD